MGDDIGYSDDARIKNAWRIARFCRFLAYQDQIVVCATVSLYHAVREFLRTEIVNYHEIFISVPLETLVARDQKSLYSQGLQGNRADVLGVNQNFELPSHPDLVIENVSSLDNIFEHLDRIIALAD